MPTATSDMNIASDVSSMTQPGTSKETCSAVKNEQPEVKVETNVPTTNTSSESTNTLSGTSSNDVAPESSIRNETESSSEQEMLRRRRLQKFSTQLTTE